MKVKKIQKKKYKEKSKGIFKYNHEILGLLLLTLGILMIIGIIKENSIGVFGMTAKHLLLGFLGFPSYLLPPAVIIYAVLMIFKKNDRNVKLRLFYYSILLLLLSALVQTGFHDAARFENKSVWGSISLFYKDGIAFNGGGVLGGLISAPFRAVFQALGTIIILTCFTLIVIILLTNISIANFIRNIRGLINNKSKALRETVAAGMKKRDSEGANSQKKSKIIDFKAGKDLKNSRENPGDAQVMPEMNFEIKTGIKQETKSDTNPDIRSDRKTDDKADIQENDFDSVEFIMKDMKKKKVEDINKFKKDVDREIALKDKEISNYRYPSLDFLNDNPDGITDIKALKNSAFEVAKKLEETLQSFGVDAKVINISRGPAVTRYELQPSPGVKVSKIVNLSDDISLNLAASGVRIEAPIPGKAAIGIEVPNKEVTAVYLREVLESQEFARYPSNLAFGIGKDISGNTIVADIAKMPHMLIAGATGSGKSVCINSIIVSLLYKAPPDEVKLLMVDPKVVELGIYNGVPHLLIPVVTDPRKAAGALNWAVQEMVNRYKLFAEKGVRDIKGYNSSVGENNIKGRLPHIVVIIDELADLMMVAPNEVEDAICRLAQMARAAGMHLVIATQRPSVDVITGVIKANIPSRIAFAVSSQVDSRTILDMSGAEKLLGKGDMLFYPVGEPKPIRIKGAFVSDKEVEKVVDFIKSQGSAEYDSDIIEEIDSENTQEESDPGDNDNLLPQAIELVIDAGQASVSLIQRKFKVGYARAARIIDQMEARGIVGRFEGSKPRQVLISKQQWQEMQMAEN